jgi:hypothetical protein
LTVTGIPRGGGFTFEKIEVAIGDDGLLGSPADFPARTVHRFKVEDLERYAPQMTRATAEILSGFPVVWSGHD